MGLLNKSPEARPTILIWRHLASGSRLNLKHDENNNG